MTRFAPAAAFLLASLAVASAQPADDLKAMVGKWALVKAELGGNDVTAGLKYAEFEMRAGGAYRVKIGAEADEGAVTVDPAKAPKQMDVVGKAGPNAGRTIKAVYKLDGDALTVCYELSDGDRPTAFQSKAGTKQFLVEYKRAK